MIQGRSACPVHTPRFLAHGNHPPASGMCRSEVDVAHVCSSVSSSAIDSPLANFASLDMRNRNSQSECNGSRCQHFVTVGDQQEKVGTHLAKQVGETKRCDSNGFGHTNVTIGT